jgi:hypothetical protein
MKRWRYGTGDVRFEYGGFVPEGVDFYGVDTDGKPVLRLDHVIVLDRKTGRAYTGEEHARDGFESLISFVRRHVTRGKTL